MCKGLMLVVIIVLGLLNLAVSPSSTEQTEDRKIEQALNEARQASTELAEKVRGLLLEEIKSVKIYLPKSF
jgi:type II secretory pathway pseudopilin PulG